MKRMNPSPTFDFWELEPHLQLHWAIHQLNTFMDNFLCLLISTFESSHLLSNMKEVITMLFVYRNMLFVYRKLCVNIQCWKTEWGRILETRCNVILCVMTMNFQGFLSNMCSQCVSLHKMITCSWWCLWFLPIELLPSKFDPSPLLYAHNLSPNHSFIING